MELSVKKAVSLLSQMFLIQFDKDEHEALAMAIDALNENASLRARLDKAVELPESEWKDLIIQIKDIVANDFIVYKGNAEFIVVDIYNFDDDQFSFRAKCRKLCIEDNYFECNNEDYENCIFCDQIIKQFVEDTECMICFDYSDFGKTVFLTEAEAKAKLDELKARDGE